MPSREAAYLCLVGVYSLVFLSPCRKQRFEARVEEHRARRKGRRRRARGRHRAPDRPEGARGGGPHSRAPAGLPPGPDPGRRRPAHERRGRRCRGAEGVPGAQDAPSGVGALRRESGARVGPRGGTR